jgi:hypothetical protein
MEKQIVIANFKKAMLYSLYEKSLLMRGGISDAKLKLSLKQNIIDYKCNDLNCVAPLRTLNDSSVFSGNYITSTTIGNTYRVEVKSFTNANYLFSVSNTDYTITQANNILTLTYIGAERVCSQPVTINCYTSIGTSCGINQSLTIGKSCRTNAECDTDLFAATPLTVAVNVTNNGYVVSANPSIVGAVYTFSDTPLWTRATVGRNSVYTWTGVGLYCQQALTVNVTVTQNECTINKTTFIPITC